MTVQVLMTKLVYIKTPEHAEALRKRDCFLQSHPELRNLQREIDTQLDKAATDHNRLVVIHNLMMDRFLQLHRKLQSLVRRNR